MRRLILMFLLMAAAPLAANAQTWPGWPGPPPPGYDPGSAIADLRAGEAASIAGMEGKMSVQQVVEAVMSAEKSLQTALAVRDKVVSAYQEIGRMAI